MKAAESLLQQKEESFIDFQEVSQHVTDVSST